MAHRPLHIAGSALITGLLLTAALALTARRGIEGDGATQDLAAGAIKSAEDSVGSSSTADWLPSGSSTPITPPSTETPPPFPGGQIAHVLADAPSGGERTIIPASRGSIARHAPRPEHLGFEELPPPPVTSLVAEMPITGPQPADSTSPIRELVSELSQLRHDLQSLHPSAAPAAAVRSEMQSLRSELAALAEQRRLETLHDDVRRLADRQETLEHQLRPPAPAQAPDVPETPSPPAADVGPDTNLSAATAAAAVGITPIPGDTGRFAARLIADDPAMVVRRLSELTGGNLILSSAVTGRVSLALAAATAEELLSAVASALDCAVVDDGPARLIVPAAQAAARRQAAEQTIAKLIRPGFISAQDLYPLVSPMLTPGLGEVAVMPPGPVADDAPPRAQRDVLLVVDFPPVVAQVEAMLAEIDVPPEQLIIEAVITSIVWNERTSCGVVPALQQAGVCSAPMRRDRQSGRHRSAQTAQFRGRPQDLLAHLGQLGELHIEASPTLQVLNRQPAEVEVGANIAYRESVAFGKRLRLLEEEIDFLPGRTFLSVRPFLQGDDAVRLQVHPRVTHVHPDPVSRLPREEIAELTTDLTIPLGCTAVIGGLTRSSHDSSPAITSLERWFGRRRAAAPCAAQLNDTTELVILLTPRRSCDVPVTEPAPLPIPSHAAPVPPEAPPPVDYMPPALPLPQQVHTEDDQPGWLARVLGERRGTERLTEPTVVQSDSPVPPPLLDVPVPVLEEAPAGLASDVGDWSTLDIGGFDVHGDADVGLDIARVQPIPVEYAPAMDLPAVQPVAAIITADLVPPEPAAPRSVAPPAAREPDAAAETYVPPAPAPPAAYAVVDLALVPPPPPDPIFEPEPAVEPAPFIPPAPQGRPRKVQRERADAPRRGVQRREWHMQMEESRRR